MEACLSNKWKVAWGHMGMTISVMWEQPLFNRILILNYSNVGIKGLFMQLIVPKESVLEML